MTFLRNKIFSSSNNSRRRAVPVNGLFPLTATGGTIVTASISGTLYVIHKFTTTGSAAFSISSISNNLYNNKIQYFVIAGGGSGGLSDGSSYAAGGGGAGGVLTGSFFVSPTSSYAVFVGAGGVYPSGSAQNSIFNGFTALSGGRGGDGTASDPVPSRQNGSPGGSGGGGGGGLAGAGGGGAGTAGHGNNGGSGVGVDSPRAGGGGGGWTVAGSNGSSGVGGAGGAGRWMNFDGSPRYYAGGGGGGGTTVGAGGSGGGGSGSNGTLGGQSGEANTGGGGGGARGTGILPGSGSSGIVMVRYPLEIIFQDPGEP